MTPETASANSAYCCACKTELPLPTLSTTGDALIPWKSWWLPSAEWGPSGTIMQRVCEECFERHYRQYEIATYCPNCGANAKAFRRYYLQDIVIGCPRCDRRLQSIPDRDAMFLSEEKRDEIQRLFFDFWEGR